MMNWVSDKMTGPHSQLVFQFLPAPCDLCDLCDLCDDLQQTISLLPGVVCHVVHWEVIQHRTEHCCLATNIGYQVVRRKIKLSSRFRKYFQKYNFVDQIDNEPGMVGLGGGLAGDWELDHGTSHWLPAVHWRYFNSLRPTLLLWVLSV